MKVTIEIGPNRVTRFMSRIANAIKKGGTGIKEGWKEFNPPREPVSPVNAKIAKLS